MKRILNVIDWVFSVRPQFVVVERDDDNIWSVERIADKKHFSVNEYDTPNGCIHILGFDKDNVHVFLKVGHIASSHRQDIMIMSDTKKVPINNIVKRYTQDTLQPYFQVVEGDRESFFDSFPYL